MVEKQGGNYHKDKMFQILEKLIFEELDTAEKVKYRKRNHTAKINKTLHISNYVPSNI